MIKTEERMNIMVVNRDSNSEHSREEFRIDSISKRKSGKMEKDKKGQKINSLFKKFVINNIEIEFKLNSGGDVNILKRVLIFYRARKT